MIIMYGSPVSVLPGKPDRKTGEIHPVAQIQHRANESPDSAVSIDNLKCKTAAQAAAFRAAIGKNIRVAVKVWATETGTTGFWLETGVMPTVITSPAGQ